MMKNSLSKALLLLILVISAIIINACISQFVPEVTEDRNLLVVEGLITDQPGQNSIKLSASMPLGLSSSANPLTGCTVSVSDDLGNFSNLVEKENGVYSPDPSFQGVVGRYYTLHISTNESHHYLHYQSAPVLLKPVPPIDSLFYDRRVLTELSPDWPTGEGCQIFLNTHDPSNNCQYFKWKYVETWEMSLPYIVQNKICWVSNKSEEINIKNTTSLSEVRISKVPIKLVTNESDRLKIKYSILVNQYSLNEDEYIYWEELKNVDVNVGDLYDIIPASIPSNIRCIENPTENVLGYFSVSAVKSKRIFIKDIFRGMPDLYKDCANKVIGYNDPIPDLGLYEWIIVDHPQPPPGYKVLTYYKGCADCTARGTNIKPDFWQDK